MNLQYPFNLSGSKMDDHWSQVTNNQWNNMLSKHWTDKGFHIYSRLRERGPAMGINTPHDFEFEMNKGTVSPSSRSPNRYEVRLLVMTGDGKHATVIYDYDDKKKVCQLVTMTFQ